LDVDNIIPTNVLTDHVVPSREEILELHGMLNDYMLKEGFWSSTGNMGEFKKEIEKENNPEPYKTAIFFIVREWGLMHNIFRKPLRSMPLLISRVGPQSVIARWRLKIRK
jgi:hypothetical protein